MAVDKNWSVNVMFDLAGTDAVILQHLVEAVRPAVPKTWAVWGRPTGIVYHEVPHVAFSAYLPLSEDPIARVRLARAAVEHQLRLVERDGQLEFAACSIDVIPAVDVNWAPGVQGTAEAMI